MPPSELKEIRELAFDGATKRYVLSDASIESQYQEKLASHIRKKEEASSKPPADVPIFDFERAVSRIYDLTPAVTSVRGIQLNPSTPSLCLVSLDFEPSRNPHARLPEKQVRAERFERPDGSHYWVIDW
jgi:hypothetical protein